MRYTNLRVIDLVQDLITCYLNNKTIKEVEDYLSKVAILQINEWKDDYDDDYLECDSSDEVADLLWSYLTSESSLYYSIITNDVISISTKLNSFNALVSDDIKEFLDEKYPDVDNILSKMTFHVYEVFNKVAEKTMRNK